MSFPFCSSSPEDKPLSVLCVAKTPTEIQGLTGFKKQRTGASLVAQWLRIHLTMQGTWVQALVQEDPTYHGATKPVRHNY